MCNLAYLSFQTAFAERLRGNHDYSVEKPACVKIVNKI